MDVFQQIPELIKSYLSSAVGLEPSGLAYSGMRVFLRVCRKWFAQTLVCAHPAPTSSSPQIHASPSPAQLTMGLAWPEAARASKQGLSARGDTERGGWVAVSVVAVNFLAPLLGSWVPETWDSLRQEQRVERVIITCLSFSRDV